MATKLILYLSLSYQLQWAGVTVALCMAYRTTVTMWLKVSNLLCLIPNLYKNI